MKGKKKTSKLRSTQKKPHPTRDVASPVPSERALQDLATREEAAELTAEGKLPKGATHAILEKNPDGTIKTVKRGRYYMTG